MTVKELEQGTRVLGQTLRPPLEEVVIFEAKNGFSPLSYDLNGQSVRARSIREYRGKGRAVAEIYIEDFPQLKISRGMECDFIPADVSLSGLPEARILVER